MRQQDQAREEAGLMKDTLNDSKRNSRREFLTKHKQNQQSFSLASSLGVVVHACNLRTTEVGVGRSGVQRQS